MKVGNKEISRDSIFIIAEIGSNHLGNIKLCRQMFKKAKECGVDAVKLQKRNNKSMFTKTAYNSQYSNEYSYGSTYGEHREKLDWFGESEYRELISLCEELDLIFFATAFDFESADFLHSLNMPIYKIASCDANNTPLLKHVASFKKPMIISLGGCDLHDVQLIEDAIGHINPHYALLHCISTYPNQDEDLQLGFISNLCNEFQDHVIGFSSHHPAVFPCLVAYTQGARVFEVHYTMNRAMGGTDHAFSFETHALEKLCEDLRRLPLMLGDGSRRVLDVERRKGSFLHKMGKSVHPARTLKIGEVIRKEDIILRSPADGIPASQYDEVVGRELLSEVSTSEELNWEKLK